MPVPSEGRVFGFERWAGLGECAPSGRIRLDGLAGWFQDVAFADVEDAGLADSAVWVVRRTAIRVGRWPRFGERVRVRTFCSGVGRMWAERRTSVGPADGSGESWVEAVALWVHLDPVTRMPSVLSEHELTVYDGTGYHRRVRARLHHPRPSGTLEESPWIFRSSDMDVADHINNAAYWEPLEQRLLGVDGRGADPDGFSAEIEFRSPAQPGPVTILSDGGARLWIVGDADELHASILVGAATLAGSSGD